MRRIATFALSLFILAGLTLAGCDSGGGGGGGPEPALSLSKDQLDLTVPGGASTSDTAQFTVNYKGLDGAPSAEGTGKLTVNVASESEGSQTYNAFYDGSVGSVTEGKITVTGSKGDTQLSDSLSVTISPGFIATSFSPTFADVESFEKDTIITSGNTSVTMDSTTVDTANTTGVAALEVSGSSGGSVTFERPAVAPSADRLTFLVKPNSNTDFNLTITFNGSNEATVPVASSDSWLKYTVQFNQLGGFSATRSSPLESVTMSADASVTFHLDGIYLSSADRKLVEINDFEETTLAYGPPFCGGEYGITDNVANESDGFRARTVSSGSGCFGYNYNDLTVDFEASDVLSFYAKGGSGDSLYVFLETNGGVGQFNYGNGIQVAVPSGSWGRVTVRMDSLGAADSTQALLDPGLSNVGFEPRGNTPQINIDDIKLEKASSGSSTSLW